MGIRLEHGEESLGTFIFFERNAGIIVDEPIGRAAMSFFPQRICAFRFW